jgi:hypothetical protein
VVLAAAATDVKLLGDAGDGSRAIPVHLIPLVDEEGEKITLSDEPLLPFSMRQTCGLCHNYDKISTGWHFNAAEPNVAAGRRGQPWILVDAGTGTQIPLSYRPWPGTFRPEQLGLTPWQFVQIFGRHMPGGGVGELDSDNPDEVMRGFVSGKLEVNCLSCHDADPAHDQGRYAVQIARQNFRWAAAATCGFASISGSAKSMPDTYDPFMPGALDDPKLVPPTVVYRENTFDHKKRVFFDITRKVPNERCYFCHSNMDTGSDSLERWAADEDVHLMAGLKCVDCHRNGVGHNITWGYEGEQADSSNPIAAVSSCEGCHLGHESSSNPVEGRLGAPVPEHPGIPPVHFDKLTCTACHSGSWPDKKTHRVKTSRAHSLGTLGINKSNDVLPHIIYPVFAKQQDGKIAPHKLFWPAYWGTVKDEKITPIDLEVVKKTVRNILAKQKLPRSSDWRTLTTEHIAEGIKALQKKVEGRAVYVSGGRLYYLRRNKLATSCGHPSSWPVAYNATKPYLWPIAHDVRPAAQSLGVRRCEDCHSTNEAFFFGEVEVDSPLISERDCVKKMVEFQNLNPVYTKLFAMSFVFRPLLKVVALGSCAVLGMVLLLYGLKALACIARVLIGED